MKHFYDSILLSIKTNIEVLMKCQELSDATLSIYVDTLEKIHDEQYFEGSKKKGN